VKPPLRWLYLLAFLTGCAGKGWVNSGEGLSNYGWSPGAECYKDADCPNGHFCVANRCSLKE
jgi:hypothetical protein